MTSAQCVTVDLPFPPSANRLWRHAGIGKAYKSAEYKAWLTEAGYKARQQAKGHVAGCYALRVIAGPPDRRKRDLDNLLKPISDLIEGLGLIEGDHLCQRIEAEWSSTVSGVRVFIISTERAA